MFWRVQQLLRVLRDLEDPLAHLALLDNSAGAPAAAIDHLLVGEHGHVDRVPVEVALLALGEARAHEVEEHLLLMLVVAGIAGGDLAAPIERQAHRLKLLLHRGDVVVGPGLGMDAALDGGVLRRHAEGVPAHRVQHRIAARAHETGDHVAHGVVAHMPHVDAPGRIGEHLQDVILPGRRLAGLGGPCERVRRRLEDAGLFPGGLPAGFRGAGIVAGLC